jgi:hypothetical protein
MKLINRVDKEERACPATAINLSRARKTNAVTRHPREATSNLGESHHLHVRRCDHTCATRCENVAKIFGCPASASRRKIQCDGAIGVMLARTRRDDVTSRAYDVGNI